MSDSRILVFAYFFPPIGGIAPRRTLGFIRGLTNIGWSIVTLAPRSTANATMDEYGLDEVPESVRVKRVAAWEPRSWKLRHFVMFPDEWAWWSWRAYLAARSITARETFDVIYASGPPFSSFIAAALVADSRKVPLVLDLRDPWSLNLMVVNRERSIRLWLEMRLERWLFRRASAVVINTPEARDAYVAAYPDLASKFVCIPNGFDEIVDSREIDTPLPLRIVHAGAFNGTRVAGLSQVLDAIDAAGLSSDSIRLVLAGPQSTHITEMISSHSAGDCVEMLGILPHKEVNERLGDSDAMLLVSNTEPGTDLHVPGKLYEYLAVDRPVIALTDAAGIRRVMEETHAGFVVPIGDVSGLASLLTGLVEDKRRGELRRDADAQAVASYTRERLTAQLDELLRSVIERGSLA